MATLAFCDDNPAVREEVLALIQGFNERQLRQNPPGALLQSSAFESPEILFNSLMMGVRYDIYLLDIEMPEVNGIELARRIRRKDKTGLIIFLTDHFDYVLDGYTVAAFRYVPKERVGELFDTTMQDALSVLGQPSLAMVLETEEGQQRLPLEELVYAQKDGRMIELHTRDQRTYHCRKGIRELYEELNHPFFIFIDYGCFINIHYLSSITDNYANLSAGNLKLPISRRRIGEVKSALARAWSLTSEIQ